MLLGKTTCCDLYVKIKFLFNMLCELWIQERFVTKSSLEKYTNTFNVTIKVAEERLLANNLLTQAILVNVQLTIQRWREMSIPFEGNQ